MKLAMMTSVHPDAPLDELIPLMQQHGYEGLEPRVGWGHAAGIEPALSPEQRGSVRRQLADAGLSVCSIATGAKFATDEASKLREAEDEAKAAIDLAADLGCPVVRTFGGPKAEGDINTQVQRCADNYRPISEFAASRGVCVCMETHDAWCVSAQVSEVVRRLGHPNMRALWDLRHPARHFERPAETFANLGDLTAHIQWSNGYYPDLAGPLRDCLAEDGVLDMDTPLRMMADHGYRGFASLEIIYKRGSGYDGEGTMASYSRAFHRALGRG